MNLADLLDVEPAEHLNTSIGELSMFWLSAKDLTVLLNDEGKALAATDPPAFVRRLAKYVYYPSDQLRDGKYKPEHAVLSDDQLASLTDAEVDEIAAAYLKHNEYLYSDETEQQHVEKNEAVAQLSPGGEKHPRKDGESNSQYLSRVILLHEDERRKRLESILKSISRSFPPGLTESVSRMQSVGEELRKSLAAWPRATDLQVIVPQAKFADAWPASAGSRIDSAKIARSEQEAREKPFKDLGKLLQFLITLTKQATGFAVEANEVQTQIAAVLNNAVDENRKTSKTNTRLSIAVLVLTGIGLLITIANIYGEEQNQTQAYVNSMLEEVKAIRNSLDAARDMERSEWEELRGEVIRLRLQLDERSRKVEELEKTVKEQAHQFDELRSGKKK